MATNTDEREEIKPVAPTEQTKWRDPSLVGKYMVDPKTGLAGLFRSPDNGETWVLTDTVYGHVYNQDEVDNIWDNGAGHKVADEIKSATADLPNVRKQADEAVKFAESAIAASKVNSDAIVAQSSAVVEAKSAMDSATAEIQQTAANAASDAAKIRADVAQVQSEVDTAKAANSASVEALKSDVSAAKQDLADVHDSLTKAQSAIEQNQKAINDSIAQINANVDATNQDLAGIRKDLTKAQSDITANQKAVNDNVAQINADITQDRKDIASAQQANEDTAKQLDDYSKQAQEQERTIKAVQDKQDGFSIALADVQGNVAQVSDKVDGLSANLKDAQGNVASVKAQADQLSATLTDHGKAIATLTASAKELSSTLKDADGRLSKVEQTAQTNSSTLSDVQGDLSQVKQDATTLTATLKDAQGNISTLQQKADGTLEQLKSAQGDIASLQTDVTGVKATLASHEGDIHTLQADSKTLKDDMTDAQGNISSLQKSSTKLDSEMSSQDGRLSKVEQTAKEHTTTISNLDDKLNNKDGINLQIGTGDFSMPFTANNGSIDVEKYDDHTKMIHNCGPSAGFYLGYGNGWFVPEVGETYTFSADIKGKGTISGDHFWYEGSDSHSMVTITLTDDWQRISNTVHIGKDSGTWIIYPSPDSSGVNDFYVKHIKIERGSVATPWTPAPEDLATVTQVKQTSDSITTTLKNVQGDVDQVTQKANGTSEQLADVKGNITNIQKDVSGLKQTTADNAGNIHTLQSDSKTLKDDMQDAQGNISSLQKTSTSLVSEFRDHDGRLSKVEQTATEHTSELADTKGNLDKVTQKADNLQLLLSDAQKNIQNIQLDAKGLHDTLTGQSNQLASLNVTLNNLDSKYSGITGDLQSKQTALSTEQQQTKDMLLRKADKSEVDNVKGTVNQVSAEQKTMADQINQKVSSTEYQTLKDKVNGLRIGTRNLLHNTSDQYRTLTGDGYLCQSTASDVFTSVANYHGGDSFTYAATITNHSTKNVTLETWLFNQSKQWLSNNEAVPYPIATHSQDVSPGESNKRVSTTFQISEATWYVRTYVIFDGGGAPANSQVQVKDERLVEGNIAGTWEANPNDTIASIQKNATAIDETSKFISLMAKQTEVDNVKNTAQQISSRLDILAGEVKSKVDETRVNNIVDGKGYATTSTVQSLVDQKAGTINESITNLDAKYKAKDGVNLQTGTGDCSFPFTANQGQAVVEKYDDHTKMIHAYGSPSGFYLGFGNGCFIPDIGETYTISADIKGKGYIDRSGFKYEGSDSVSTNKVTLSDNWQRISCTVHISQHLGTWIFYPIPGSGNNDFYVKHIKIEKGSVTTPWTPAPSDNATVTQVQSLTASIDGLQSNVTNFKNDTSSQITQLSNVIQSKVSASDFNDLKDKTTWKSTDNIDLNTAVSQQKIFVKGGSNLPPGDYWWYVQVESGYDSRIVQYAVSDRDNKHFSRQYDGANWSVWAQDASESDITQLRDDINLRVKSGDLLSQINLTAGNTLIQSNKLYLDASSVAFSGRAFIPSAAIASLSADKVNTGWLNTNNVSLGDGRTRIRADHDYMYIQPTGSAASNTGIRMGYSGLDFLTNVIPNGYNSSVPYYSIGYDGAANGYFKISAFDHINPGGATATQNWFSMVDAISLTNSEINFAAEGNMHMQVVNGGVNIKPTLFFQNNTNNGTWAGFTRADNSNIVEFSSGDNNGENFRIDCGARFMQYVYINGNARAQQWLTNSTLSKKTNIRKLDQQIALDKIRQDDQYLYEYKRNIEQGIYDPQASFIIDDVNDVSHYSVPREFIDQSGNYREPNVELAYLIAAFQAIDKQVQKQKEEIKELKEKLQHE